jgi:Eukaryotic glutathione synthase, ATP binding domain
MLVELSSAAKCPSVAYQLAGAKKVQQDLAAPGVVERFIGQQRGAALRGLFAGACSLRILLLSCHCCSQLLLLLLVCVPHRSWSSGGLGWPAVFWTATANAPSQHCGQQLAQYPTAGWKSPCPPSCLHAVLHRRVDVPHSFLRPARLPALPMQAYGRWTILRSLPPPPSSPTHSHAHGPMFSSPRERVAATTCMGASLQLLSRLGWSSISSPRLLRSRCHMLQQLEVVVHSQPTY